MTDGVKKVPGQMKGKGDDSIIAPPTPTYDMLSFNGQSDSIWRRNKPCAIAMQKLSKKYGNDFCCIEYYWQQKAQEMWMKAKLDLFLNPKKNKGKELVHLLYKQLLGYEQNIIDKAEKECDEDTKQT